MNSKTGIRAKLVVLSLGVVIVIVLASNWDLNKPSKSEMTTAANPPATEKNEFNAPPATPGNMSFRLKESQEGTGSELRYFGENSLGDLGGGSGDLMLYKNGRVVLDRGAPINYVQLSPDGSKLLISGEGFWGEIYTVRKTGMDKMDRGAPDVGDIEWVWLGDDSLLGVSNIYEIGIRPGLDNSLIERTELYFHDIGENITQKVSWPSLELRSNEVFRVRGVTSTGEIEVEIVSAEDYFNRSGKVARSGRYKIHAAAEN